MDAETCWGGEFDGGRRSGAGGVGDGADDAPVQPLPFSHKAHAGTLKLPCKMCHPSPDPGESMTFVAPAVCMQCHSAIKTDAPAIQKLAQYAEQGKEVPWVRVYQIPAWVNFSHRAHLEAKNTCEDCHGKVVERDALYEGSKPEYGHVHRLPRGQARERRLQFLSRAAVNSFDKAVTLRTVPPIRGKTPGKR